MATLAEIMQQLPGSEVEIHAGHNIRRLVVSRVERDGRAYRLHPECVATRSRDSNNSASWRMGDAEAVEFVSAGKIAEQNGDLHLPIGSGHLIVVNANRKLDWGAVQNPQPA